MKAFEKVEVESVVPNVPKPVRLRKSEVKIEALHVRFGKLVRESSRVQERACSRDDET